MAVLCLRTGVFFIQSFGCSLWCVCVGVYDLQNDSTMMIDLNEGALVVAASCW
jgi:hypothetical protein